jgi:Transposase DDE domain group 1
VSNPSSERFPLLARLRDAKRDASSGTVEALEKIRCAIRRRFGRRVRIIVRADSGFAREEIMAWCEQSAAYCRLRLDPLHALIAGKADVLGEDRLCEGDKGKALAAHSTLNRLELGVLSGDPRYKKITARPQEVVAC